MEASQTCIVIVNWKRPEDTCLCIQSLLEMKEKNWHVVLYDNGSPDNSAAILQGWLSQKFLLLSTGKISSEFVNESIYDFDVIGEEMGRDVPKVRLIVGDKNLGFAAGCNRAFSGGVGKNICEYVWYLNNDTKVQSGSIERLVSKINTPGRKYGLVGCSVLYMRGDGTVQALGGGQYSVLTGRSTELGKGDRFNAPSIDELGIEARMDYVCGATMFTRREHQEQVGLMSEEYFLYFEELDWARRFSKLGYKLGYAKDVVVYHNEGAALGSGARTHRSELAERYGARGRLRFTTKFHPWALPSVLLYFFAQLVYFSLPKHRVRRTVLLEELRKFFRSWPLRGR